MSEQNHFIMQDTTKGQLFLLPHHQKLITDSAISPSVQDDTGYRSITVQRDLKQHGFSHCPVPGLLVPVHDVHGQVRFHQYRPDIPRIKDGKQLKYETPPKTQLCLHGPPSMRAALSDPSIPLWITEGVRKADALASLGICSVALLGVWNWRGKNEHEGSVALSCWESIALKDRDIRIAFDSDVTTKEPVFKAMDRLVAFLQGRGAK